MYTFSLGALLKILCITTSIVIGPLKSKDPPDSYIEEKN